jgi:hypothetical protein
LTPFEALPAFLTDLRASGFVIGPDRQRRLLTVLAHLASEGAVPRIRSRVRNRMSAVVCSSGAQQAQFAQLFEVWFGTWDLKIVARDTVDGPQVEWTDLKPPVPVPVPPDPDRIAKLPQRQRIELLPRRERERFLLRWAIAAALLFVVILIMPPISLDRFRSTEGSDQNRATDPHGPQPVPEPEDSPPQPLGLREVAERHGIWLLGLLVIPLSYLVARIASGQAMSARLSKKANIVARLDLLRLVLRSREVELFNDAGMIRQAQPLRRREQTRDLVFDIGRTIDLTVASGGFLAPMYSARLATPEYVSLIDRACARDHQWRLFARFCDFLHESGVQVERYYFDGDPRRCFRSTVHRGQSLREVASEHQNKRLLLLGTARLLFNPVTGHRHRWTEELTFWNQRALITPKPRSDWGYDEHTIQRELGFTVVYPGKTEIPILVDAFSASGVHPVAEAATSASKARDELFRFLDARPLLWFDASAPDELIGDRLVHLLKSALGRSGLLWLTACAIYPRLDWQLTLHLGKRVYERNRKTDSFEGDTLVLARLPWFRAGWMPDWLRRKLLDALGAVERGRLYGFMDELFLTVTTRGERNLALTLALEKQRNELPAAEQCNVQELIDNDAVLVDLLNSRRDGGAPIYNVPGRTLRALAGAHVGALLRRASTSDLKELLDESREFVQAEIRRCNIRVFRHAGQSSFPALGTEFADVLGFETRAGAKGRFDEKFVLYRPGASARVDAPYTAHLLDAVVAEVIAARKRLIMRIAWPAALALTVVSFLSFESFFKEEFPTLGLLGLACVMFGPFVMLHVLVVRPALKLARTFPKVPIDREADVGGFSKLERLIRG